MAYLIHGDKTTEIPGLEYHEIVGAYAEAETGDPRALASWLKFQRAKPALARLAPAIAKAMDATASTMDPTVPVPLRQGVTVPVGAAQLSRLEKQAAKTARAVKRRKAAERKAARWRDAARDAVDDAFAAGRSVGAAPSSPTGPCPCPDCHRDRLKAELRGAPVITKSQAAHHPGPDFSAYDIPAAVIDYGATIYDPNPKRREQVWKAVL